MKQTNSSNADFEQYFGDEMGDSTGRKTSNLRRRFGLLLAISLLPILLLSIWQSYYDFKRDTQMRAAALDASAAEAVSDIVDLLKNAKSILGLSADLVGPETCAADLKRVIRESPDIYNMAVYWGGASPTCVAKGLKSQIPMEATLAAITPETPFKFNVIDQSHETPTRRRMLVIGYGNFGPDNTLNNILFSKYNLSTLSDLRNRENLPRDVQVSIFSRDGQILVGDEVGTVNMRESWATLLGVEDRVTLTLPDAQHKTRDVVLLPTRASEVFLAISTPHPGLISWNKVNPFASILLPILGWIFAYIAIWLALEKLILSRIRAIGRGVLRFSKSNTVPPVQQNSKRPDAISDLEKSFRKMASRIVARESDLTETLDEKDEILREVHHRVKNNLQIIISLLNMGKRQVKDPLYSQALDDTRNRVTAISQVHKTLHESDGMMRVDLVPFMTELTSRLGRALNFEKRNIKIVSHVDANPVSADTATPISLFIVEALTNAAKHGLVDGGTISVTLIEANGVLTLTTQDNGIGAKAAREREAVSPELSTCTGTGEKLMQGFARQLGGTYEAESSPHGYICRLSFPRER